MLVFVAKFIASCIMFVVWRRREKNKNEFFSRFALQKRQLETRTCTINMVGGDLEFPTHVFVTSHLFVSQYKLKIADRE